MDRMLNPMEVDHYAREFVASRRRSASRTRPGGTSFPLLALARLAAALERFAGRVEGWASGAPEPAGRSTEAQLR